MIRGNSVGLASERLVREARSAAQLRHPGIVSVFELGALTDSTGSSGQYIAMEYVEGRTLEQTMPDLELKDRVQVLRDVAQSVEHAHAHGVVHRDLKPSNILIRRDGRPVVADFGLAHWDAASRDLTRSGAMLGTPTHMSPEQTLGAEGAGPEVDVWALGVLLYQALTNRLPFHGDSIAVLFYAIQTADPVPPRQVVRRTPAALEAICLRALEKEPARRYSSAGGMAEELTRWLEGRPIGRDTSRVLGRFGRVRRWRGLALVAAGAALAAAATLAVLVHRPRGEVSRQVLANLSRALAADDLGSIEESLAELEGRMAPNDVMTWAPFHVSLARLFDRRGPPRPYPLRFMLIVLPDHPIDAIESASIEERLGEAGWSDLAAALGALRSRRFPRAIAALDRAAAFLPAEAWLVPYLAAECELQQGRLAEAARRLDGLPANPRVVSGLA